MNMGCILLAAGAGERFGGNKLIAKIQNVPMIEYILGNLPLNLFSECVIVAGNRHLLRLAADHGISGIINNNPGEGIHLSIKMGIAQLADVDACMFCVSDQPLLSRQTISAMVHAYRPNTILSLSSNGKRGNPVIFPSFLLDELASLKKGEYGTKVICDHEHLLALFDIDDNTQLIDIDTKDALNTIESMIDKESL